MNIEERIAFCERKARNNEIEAERAAARALHWRERVKELRTKQASMSPRDQEYWAAMYGTGHRQATHSMNEAIQLLLEYHTCDVYTLAHMVGVSHTTIYNLCNGRCGPSTLTLDKLGMERTGYAGRYKFRPKEPIGVAA